MEKLWYGIKAAAIMAALVIGFITLAPMAKAIVGYFNAKEMLYNEQMIRLSEAGDVASKRVEFNNELLQDQIKTLRDEIKDQVKARNQEIVAYGEVIAELKQDLKEQKGNTFIDPNDPTKDYVETVLRKQLNDKSEIPWGWAMYSPNIKSEDKWTTGTYPLKIHTKIALGEDKESGGRKDAYVESYLTSDIFLADKGKKFPVEIDSIMWVEKPPKEKSFEFNPRFSLGLGVQSGIFGSLEMSFWSYGRTKGDMDWRLLSLGFGVGSDEKYLYVAPIEYNIGKPLPFMENLFLAPFIGLDDDSNSVWGGVLQVPF
jgi:hypothetical protein